MKTLNSAWMILHKKKKKTTTKMQLIFIEEKIDSWQPSKSFLYFTAVALGNYLVDKLSSQCACRKKKLTLITKALEG